MDKSYDKRNVIKTLEAMITCNKKQAEGYPECVKDCDDCSLLYEQGNFEERIEVLEMAIKALEQEPKTDSWSIKDVADTFKKHGLIRVQEPSGNAINRKLVCAFLSGLISDETERKKALQYINELPSVNLMLCEDAINREDALMCLTGEIKETDTIETIIARFVKRIRKLPPVNLAKTGKWIKHYKCTSCGYYINFGQWGELYTKEFKYCPNCGARMIEPQESERE